MLTLRYWLYNRSESTSEKIGDPRADLSIAILTNGNRGLADFTKRFVPLNQKIRASFAQ